MKFYTIILVLYFIVTVKAYYEHEHDDYGFDNNLDNNYRYTTDILDNHDYNNYDDNLNNYDDNLNNYDDDLNNYDDDLNNYDDNLNNYDDDYKNKYSKNLEKHFELYNDNEFEVYKVDYLDKNYDNNYKNKYNDYDNKRNRIGVPIIEDKNIIDNVLRLKEPNIYDINSDTSTYLYKFQTNIQNNENDIMYQLEKERVQEEYIEYNLKNLKNDHKKIENDIKNGESYTGKKTSNHFIDSLSYFVPDKLQIVESLISLKKGINEYTLYRLEEEAKKVSALKGTNYEDTLKIVILIYKRDMYAASSFDDSIIN